MNEAGKHFYIFIAHFNILFQCFPIFHAKWALEVTSTWNMECVPWKNGFNVHCTVKYWRSCKKYSVEIIGDLFHSTQVWELTFYNRSHTNKWKLNERLYGGFVGECMHFWIEQKNMLLSVHWQLIQCTLLNLYSVERPDNVFTYKRLGSLYFRLIYFGHSSNTRLGSAGRGKYLFTRALYTNARTLWITNRRRSETCKEHSSCICGAICFGCFLFCN